MSPTRLTRGEDVEKLVFGVQFACAQRLCQHDSGNLTAGSRVDCRAGPCSQLLVFTLTLLRTREGKQAASLSLFSSVL